MPRIAPQGAIYLSLRLNFFGRSLDGVKIERNEQIRRALLDRAAVATNTLQTQNCLLLDDGRETGRLEGYPGEDFFWFLLGELIEQARPPDG